MSEKRKRKKISAKRKLEVFKRDDYTCQTCGRSPPIYPGLPLEVDHIEPFPLGGSDEISNLQTKCLDCNRGKGNNEYLNRTLKNALDASLSFVNPKILEELKKRDRVSVVANQEEYVEIMKKNAYDNFYKIEASSNMIMGFQAMQNIGIYTLNDNHGSKVHFFISKVST